MNDVWEHVIRHERSRSGTLPSLDFVFDNTVPALDFELTEVKVKAKTTVSWAPVYKDVLFPGIAIGSVCATREEATNPLTTKVLRIEISEDLSLVSASLVDF